MSVHTTRARIRVDNYHLCAAAKPDPVQYMREQLERAEANYARSGDPFELALVRELEALFEASPCTPYSLARVNPRPMGGVGHSMTTPDPDRVIEQTIDRLCAATGLTRAHAAQLVHQLVAAYADATVAIVDALARMTSTSTQPQEEPPDDHDASAR